MLDDLALSGISDPQAREGVVRLLNVVEELTAALRAAQDENQRLRDEIQRLKGEQGRPAVKGPTPRRPPGDYSSEPERHTPRTWTKRAKLPQVRIDREQVLDLDPATLPPDAEFKGYEPVVVQDVVFHTDTLRFLKAKYYSRSERRTYLAPLPPGYTGEFGPGLKALAIVLAFGAQVSEPKIRELFGSVGVQISAGQVSNLLIHHQDQFHAEQAAVYEAGLRSSPWQHLDATPTRVNGQNQQCHVVCQPLYTVYRTTPGQDRQSVLDVLRNGQPRAYLLNAEAEAWLAGVGLSGVVRAQLSRLPRETVLDAAQLDSLLKEHVPRLGPQQRRWVEDALAIAAYHAQTTWPVVDTLVCDDAPQFRGVTAAEALCWIHEGRHYKKLLPVVAMHREALATFRGQFWDYYRELSAYRAVPTAAERARLEQRFDELFATRTAYWALNERITLTAAKKAALLQVLAHPELPLHNNPAELGARQRVRKRDVSFGPRGAAGIQAWDTFQSLAATATKLGVSFYVYVQDRLSEAYRLPALDHLIAARAPALQLAHSWDAP